MPRISRVVLEGVPYHVTQRGNAQQTVFSTATDYLLYLDLLRTRAERYQLQIWAYCLMPNHIHLLVVPERPRSLSGALGRTHADYARHFNLQHRRSGHVWQARFYSCPLDKTHLWNAMAYIERNPVRAALVKDATAYRWSSALAHTAGMDPDRLLNLIPWREQYTTARWHEVLETSIADEAVQQRLREATFTGRPLGTAEFVDRLERDAHRRLRPLPVGRRRKSDAQEAPVVQSALPLEIGI